MKFKITELAGFNKILFLLLVITPFIFSISQLGEKCQFSRDCAEGYCIDETCKIPGVLEKYYTAGECNSTIDCTNGFCYQNQCIIPAKDSSVTPLASGLSNSCAGIIENCTGIICIFCNATWIILLLAAAMAAFIARSKGRITPIILIAVPVLSGIIFFPFIGAIIALLELALLAFVKPAAIRTGIHDMLQIIKKQPVQERKEEQKDKEKPKEGEGMEQLPFD
ncbi:MAG: hypothetical protein QXE90_02885 [Candidatus Micrarchaeia archaeon]